MVHGPVPPGMNLANGNYVVEDLFCGFQECLLQLTMSFPDVKGLTCLIEYGKTKIFVVITWPNKSKEYIGDSKLLFVMTKVPQ